MIGKKVGEYDPDDTFFAGTIPEVWTEEMLAGLRRDVQFLHFSQGRVPYRYPLRRRIRHRIRGWRDNGREWLALKIAPWLESP